MSKDSQTLPEIVIQHHGKTLFQPMKNWNKEGHLPSALLLTGQSGIGKNAMASFLAQWILCGRNGPSRPVSTEGILYPCGECDACQKILSKNHIDFVEITSDGDASAPETLKIDQFRKLKSSIGFGVRENLFKVIIIPGADRMTVQASQSILKLLEEPPTRWIFILTSHDPTLLLPTIVSRCQTIRLKPFPHSIIHELLQLSEVSIERREICAKLSQGSWDRALDFAHDEIWKQREIFFRFLEDPSSAIQPLTDWVLKEPSHFKIMIDLLEQLTADMIHWSTTSDLPEKFHWIHQDGNEQICAHIRHVLKKGNKSIARSFWFSQVERLSEARKELLVPINKKLLVQDILFPWLTAWRIV